MFNNDFEVSKRVSTETKIGLCKVSVPSVAVDVARSIFYDFSSKQVLVIGSWEMAQLVCEHLREAKANPPRLFSSGIKRECRSFRWRMVRVRTSAAAGAANRRSAASGRLKKRMFRL